MPMTPQDDGSVKSIGDDPLPYWTLRSEHSGAFLRLRRLLSGRSSFTLCFLTYSDSVYRDEVERFLAGRLNAKLRVAIDADERIGTETLFKRLSVNADGGPAQLVNLESWPEGLEDMLGRLNQRREALAERCRRPLLVWVLSSQLPAVATLAADLWAWRSGVFDFTLPPIADRTELQRFSVDLMTAYGGQRRERIEELERHLEHRSPLRAVDVDLMFELGDLRLSLGDVEEAETAYLRAVQVLEGLDDPRRRAVARGRIADVLETRGQFDEALRVRTEEELPIYERLGDPRLKAVTQWRIANILAARGQLDDALRIRREELLPVFERLGDVRSTAVTQGGIADILGARGELDEALRIRTEEQLPVFERLGDVRSRAVTQGKIADILVARGELDEALRIRMEEQLPIYERLGDVRSKAIAQGGIADILVARGDLEEALRIRMEEELPTYERLGDLRSIAITQGQIADILEDRGRLEDALRTYEQDVLPNIEKMNLPAERERIRARIEKLRAALG